MTIVLQGDARKMDLVVNKNKRKFIVWSERVLRFGQHLKTCLEGSDLYAFEGSSISGDVFYR